MDQKDLEINKIAAAILLAGLIAMLAGTIAKIFYGAGTYDEAEKRGYSIDVPEDTGAVVEEEKDPDLGTLLANASVESGEDIFNKKCATCHSIEQGGANKTGPNLWSVLNDPRGSKAGFAYSAALMETADQGWDYESMYAFLKNPKQYIRGTKMAYIGFKKKYEQNADVIAYMRSMGDSDLPLPEPKEEIIEPEVDVEQVEGAVEAEGEVPNDAMPDVKYEETGDIELPTEVDVEALKDEPTTKREAADVPAKALDLKNKMDTHDTPEGNKPDIFMQEEKSDTPGTPAEQLQDRVKDSGKLPATLAPNEVETDATTQ